MHLSNRKNSRHLIIVQNDWKLFINPFNQKIKLLGMIFMIWQIEEVELVETF